MPTYIVIALSLLISIPAFAKDITKRIVDFRHTRKEVRQVIFKTLNGKYSISDSPDDYAYVRVTLIVPNEKKLADFEREPNIKQDFTNETLLIEQTNSNFEYLYEISLPEKISLDITSDASPLSIKNLKNDISLKTNHKDVLLENIKSGMITVNSKSSKITVKGCSAAFKFITDNSDMDLNLLDGKLEIIAGKGEIQVNLSGEIPVEITSKSANVTLSIPKYVGYNCNFSSADNILYDFRNVKFEGNISYKLLDGKLNGGGKTLKLTTSRGKITVYNAQ
ncbi:MAG: DUF4097 domain-containing protein [Bacteroidia bacterium]|nr:DUF4097 domain-containing protein [Bacteroidia bacterium]